MHRLRTLRKAMSASQHQTDERKRARVDGTLHTLPGLLSRLPQARNSVRIIYEGERTSKNKFLILRAFTGTLLTYKKRIFEKSLFQNR